MQDKWIITKMPYKKKEGAYILSAYMAEGKAQEFQIEDASEACLLGNIYVGKVVKIVKNIEAAFLEIADKQMCYYALKDNTNPIFVNTKKSKELAVGDELLVQVVKEGVKTKEPVVSSALNLPGRYVALVHGETGIAVSAKIPEKDKERFRELLAPCRKEAFGFVVRTNARFCTEEEILAEAKALAKEYEQLRDIGSHRPCYTCLKASPSLFCKRIRDIRLGDKTEIVTDDPELFSELEAFLKEYMPTETGRLVFYEDKLQSLAKLHSLETELEGALQSRVWLKSGGYLIFQPTEALTVIDVNTGKYEGKKKKEETFLKINLEAAKEIARQLRLRNLSGMILIDFISMKEKEREEILVSFLREELAKDPVKTVFVDITGMGLVELTRKKQQKPLYEHLGEACPCCHGNGYIY